MKTIIGLYDNVTDAQQAMQALTDATFDRDSISLVVNDHEGTHRPQGESDEIGATAAAGAAVGGLGGLIIGLSALAIPGIGPVVAAGPLLTGLVGASMGAAVGGLVGALAATGVPAEQAGYYAEGVRRGGALVTVEAADENADEAADIMNRYHPVDIEERARTWRQSGWTGKNEETTFLNSAQPEWLHQGFRVHYQTHYLDEGRSYEEYEPAYQYGYGLTHDVYYRQHDWESIEAEVQHDWSQNYPNHRWEEFKDAVRYGWEQMRRAVTA